MKQTQNKQMRKGERGNVLFLILIAVALFAALSYAVTSSSRSGGGNANDESNLVRTASITQYPASVRTAIIRMMVRNGIDAQDLLFDAPAVFGGLSTADQSNAVFHPNGGGAARATAPVDVMSGSTQGTWVFSSEYQISGIGLPDANATSNDVIAFLPGVSGGICRRINEELGIAMAGTDTDGDGVTAVAVVAMPTTDDDMAQDVNDGSNTDNSGIGAYAAARVIGGDFAGQPYGCFDALDTAGNANDGLTYFHVLIER